MKKVVELHNLVTGAPLTGKDITLVRVFPNDGLEVDLVEIAASGSYLASTIDYGVYKVFDRTAGSPGVDLDQLIDMASSMVAEPALPASGSGMLHSDRTFRNAAISEVDGLATALAGKQATLAEGVDGEFYGAPGKTPRRIVAADILDLSLATGNRINSLIQVLAIDALGPGSNIVGSTMSGGAVIELIKDKVLVLDLTIAFPQYVNALGAGRPMKFEIGPFPDAPIITKLFTALANHTNSFTYSLREGLPNTPATDVYMDIVANKIDEPTKTRTFSLLFNRNYTDGLNLIGKLSQQFIWGL